MSELFVYDAIYNNGSRRRNENTAIAALCGGRPVVTIQKAAVEVVSLEPELIPAQHDMIENPRIATRLMAVAVANAV